MNDFADCPPRKKEEKTICGIIFPLLIILGTVFSLNHIFNLSSNWIFMLDGEGKLLLKQGSDWIAADLQHQKLHLEAIYDRGKVRVFELEMKRDRHSVLGKKMETFAKGRILIFEFSAENHYALIADPASDFEPMTAKTAQKKADYNFVVNANFYGSGQQIVGELILEGHKHRKESHVSGFFRVINGKPYAEPRSMFSELSGHIDYSCQAFPGGVHGAFVIKDQWHGGNNIYFSG